MTMPFRSRGGGRWIPIGSVDGIPIEVIRKQIKNLHLYVLPPDGRVRVTAPLFLSDASIAAFVRSKAGWIEQRRAKYSELPQPAERRYVSGETINLWGRPYELEVVCGRRRSMELDAGRAVLTVGSESTAEQREKVVREWYRERLKAAIEERLPVWEALTGLHCSDWQTKDMRTRWGTCNTRTRKLWLNLQLAKRPPECLDYVLLHELAHLRVRNHGRDFVAILDEYMPGWRDIRRRLNDEPVI